MITSFDSIENVETDGVKKARHLILANSRRETSLRMSKDNTEISAF